MPYNKKCARFDIVLVWSGRFDVQPLHSAVADHRSPPIGTSDCEFSCSDLLKVITTFCNNWHGRIFYLMLLRSEIQIVQPQSLSRSPGCNKWHGKVGDGCVFVF